MASRHTNTFPILGLGKYKAAAAVERAKRLGMTTQAYLKHLVEEDLAISDRAKNSTFEQLLGPGREVDEAEVDRLAESAKVSYHRRKRRGN